MDAHGRRKRLRNPFRPKGKDGDIVKFTVKPNDKEEDQTFNYTFTRGKEKAPYAITLKKKASQAEEQLEITFVPESNILPREGGNVSVLVTSSDEWTLEGSHTFVHPSATSGSDGAEVTFAVDPTRPRRTRSPTTSSRWAARTCLSRSR